MATKNLEKIPKYSCSAGNITRYFIGHREEKVQRIIEVDIKEKVLKRDSIKLNF